MRYNLIAINYIILIFFFTLARSIGDALTWDSGTVWDLKNEYHYYFFIIANFLVHIYFEYIYSDKIHPVRLSIILFPFYSFVIIYFMILMQPNSYSQNPEFWQVMIPQSSNVPFYTLPADIHALLVWIFGTIVSLKMVRESQNREIRRDSVLLLITSVLFTIANFLETLEHFTGLDINGNMMAILPFITMTILYIRNPYFSYSSPHSIDHIRVLDTRSSITYLKLDREEGAPELFDNLFGPILSSMETHLQELLLIEGKLKQIRIGDKILQISRGTRLQLLVEANGMSKAIKDGMNSFIVKLEKYVDEENQVLDLSIPEIYDLILKYPPFMVREEVREFQIRQKPNQIEQISSIDPS